MRKIITLSFLTLISIGCSNATQQTANTNVSIQNKMNVSMQKSDNPPIVSSHSSDAEKFAPAQQSKTDSNAAAKDSSPMARPIDVSRMTADVEKAEKSFKQNQKDEKAKNNLAEAYFVRAFALTEAAQYRAALGDFRKGLKLNPSNAEAKAMHGRIIDIFQNSLHREPPKEGEEPPPLPVNK
ncbi:MAG TPA: tetratricopeptide repeat protein [Pyrinomonadaceae bacterium]|nr:tetratricopeptide repeat protein [Pyrinomonadaceae bacterium]